MTALTLDTETIAKKAAHRIMHSAEFAQRRTDFPADEISVLESFVEHAYNVMTERGTGLDPLLHAPAMGESYMIQFAEDAWMGRDPLTTQRGALLLGEWLRAARVAKFRLNHAQ